MTSSIHTEWINLIFCWLSNTGESKENIAYAFVFTSPAEPSMSCLIWMVCKMGGMWPYSFCFVKCCFQDLFKAACMIHVYFLSGFFFKSLIKSKLVDHFIYLDSNISYTESDVNIPIGKTWTATVTLMTI